jgi:hypothetical protein
MKRSRIKHLNAGGTIGMTRTACGRYYTHEERDRYFDPKTGENTLDSLYLDDVTCTKCLASRYAREHGRRRK